MPDVIFAGTEVRKALNYAEVESLLITVMALSRVLVKPFVWSVTFIETVTMIT